MIKLALSFLQSGLESLIIYFNFQQKSPYYKQGFLGLKSLLQTGV